MGQDALIAQKILNGEEVRLGDITSLREKALVANASSRDPSSREFQLTEAQTEHIFGESQNYLQKTLDYAITLFSVPELRAGRKIRDLDDYLISIAEPEYEDNAEETSKLP